MQTHLSWVVLAGSYAYKIKRPVRFAFVDFSTLGLRRAACEAELALNRRFAPDLYLDVQSISQEGSHVCLGGAGQPVEYAVRMRRFETRELLSHLLTECVVDRQELAVFGVHLAQLHRQSSTCQPTLSFVEIARRNVRELSRQTQDARLARLDSWIEENAARWDAQWRARVASGFIRDVHGDLHAGNIVRWAGRLSAFDCIEFDAALRCIDTADDAAFLFMDLLTHDATAPAYAFLNGWLEANGDYASVTLLQAYVVHRALVRAKVAALARDTERCRAICRLRTPPHANARPR